MVAGKSAVGTATCSFRVRRSRRGRSRRRRIIDSGTISGEESPGSLNARSSRAILFEMLTLQNDKFISDLDGSVIILLASPFINLNGIDFRVDTKFNNPFRLIIRDALASRTNLPHDTENAISELLHGGKVLTS